MPVTLYNQFGSPPCGLVRMTAKQVGVDLVLKNLDMFKGEHRTPEYAKLNPYYRAPTIDDEGFVLFESSAICAYLVSKYAPDSGLLPKCIKQRAQVDKVLATITSTIQPHYFKFFRPRFFDLRKPTADEIKDFEDNVLEGFQHLIVDGKYAVGDTLTLADLSLAAHLTLAVELPQFNAEKFPRLAAYYERMKAELPYFDEVNRHGIDQLLKRWELLN